MRLVSFAMEMEGVDIVRVRLELFFWNTLCVEVTVVGECNHTILAWAFFVELAVLGLENTNWTCRRFFWKMSLLDQTGDKILDDSVLGYEHIVRILMKSLVIIPHFVNIESSHLFCDPLAEPRDPNSFLGIKLRKTDLEHLVVQSIASMATGICSVLRCKDLLQHLIRVSLNSSFGVLI